MVEVTRHFSTSVHIVCELGLLLHFHKKLKFWLPVGGHIDRDELPQDSARREVKEESGLDIKFYVENVLEETDTGVELIPPFKMYLHDINEFHQHINFVFIAKALNTELNPEDGETMDLKWFSKADLENSTELIKDVKDIGLIALELFEQKKI